MSLSNNYPGRDTEFFAVLKGTPTGPIVGLVELFRHNISPETPIWYEGLDDWKPALMTSLTRQLFEPGSEFYRIHPEALVIMQGRLSGADPSDMPDLIPDSTTRLDNNIPETIHPHNEAPAIPSIPPSEPANSSAKPQQPVTNSQIDIPTQPSNYLAWSIVATLLCCLPAGVVAIIYSCRVNSKWMRGRYDDAIRASNRAQLWIILSVVLGLIWTVASLLWAPLGVSILSIFGL